MENIEVLLEHLDGMWGAAQMYCGDDAYGDGYRAIRAALVEGQKPSTNNRRNACRWKYVEDGYYHTACGEDWIFPEGSPVENGLVFCPVCGKRASVR